MNRLFRNPSAALLGGILLWPASGAAADPLDTWHTRTPPVFPTTEGFEGVAHGNGRWVIIGQKGTIISSSDGVQWTAEANPAGTAKLNDLAFGNGLFVAIGAGNGVILTSPDGRQWTKQSPKSGGGLEIIHDDTRFVALAPDGFLSTSVDGVVWEYPPSIPTLYVDVGGIAFGNGTYVEVGYKRTGKPTDLWSATGLSNWQQRDPKSNENMMAVGYGLGQFVAVGQDGTLITSPDGVEWTPRDVPHTGFIWDVCVGGPYLATACQWGRVLTSVNGVDWVKRETGAPDHLTDIAYGDGTFIAVGWDGQIVQSDRVTPPNGGGSIVLSPRTVVGSEVRFAFTGTVGQVYEVESTSDCVSWNPAATITCTASPMDVVLSNQTEAQRFYRVVQP